MNRTRVEYGKAIFFGVLAIATIAVIVVRGTPSATYFAVPAVFLVLTGYFWWKADQSSNHEE